MQRLLFFFILIVGLGLGACSWQGSRRPSILVIAVERLNSETWNCDQSDPELAAGIGQICMDGVRFTHAYAPSVLSQPTLTSILTGLYPKDTKVWHNGSNYLSEKYVTAAEIALTKGYRTAFFSGGAPIWRKSGLEQGFEIFEDNITPQLHEPYRPVRRNFQLFINWLAQNVRRAPFFSVIYLSDLQFPNHETQSDLGQVRAKNFDSQLREINESLAHLFNQLKSKNRWDNTHVVLTGLNGLTRATRSGEMDGTNLHSENAQVFLMIKPARKARDAGIDWTIDANVSLADLGWTLFDWLGDKPNIKSGDTVFKLASLTPTLIKPHVTWDRDRLILVESAWPTWRGVGGTRFSLHQGSLLYLHDLKATIYNGLVDPFELQAIKITDPTVKSVAMNMRQVLSSMNMTLYEELPQALVDKTRFYRDLAQTNYGRDVLKSRLSHVYRQRPWDNQVLGWLARELIQDKDWEQLSKLGKENARPIWSFVAGRQLGAETPAPEDACWGLLDKNIKWLEQYRKCADPEFVSFAEWIRASAKQKPEMADRFAQKYYQRELEEEISRLNFQNGLVWDAAVDLPGEPRNVSLALLLKEYKAEQMVLENRLKSFNKRREVEN